MPARLPYCALSGQTLEPASRPTLSEVQGDKHIFPSCLSSSISRNVASYDRIVAFLSGMARMPAACHCGDRSYFDASLYALSADEQGTGYQSVVSQHGSRCRRNAVLGPL